MKLVLCFAALLVTQSLGFRVPFKTGRDWSKIREKWANPDVSLPIRRTEDVAENSMDIDGRIVNGQEAMPHDFPHIAALFIDGGSFCTGSLIHPRWVLTAAHCAKGKTYFDVYLGAHNVRLANEPGRLEIRATEAIVHETYDPSTLKDDIALIHLPTPVTLNKTISTIKLAASNVGDLVGTVVTIAGWGKISDDTSSISPTLNWGTSVVISNAQCALTYVGIIQGGIICIKGGTSDGSQAGTCNGDSGGPLMATLNGATEFTQIGVTSFVSSRGCQSGNPDGYTRVSEYRKWIATNTNGDVPAE